MNVKLVLNEILSSVRTVSKQKFVDKTDFETKASSFVSSIKSDLVSLNLISTSFSEDKTKQPYQHWEIKFEIIFNLNDKYIDSDVYHSGSAYIFPSKKLYEDILKTSKEKLGAIPEWNEARTLGTITGNARDY